jgi:hypothetical protein
MHTQQPKKKHESLFLLSPLPHLCPICVPNSYIGVSNLAGALLRDTGLSQQDSIITSHYTHPSSTSASQTDNPPKPQRLSHARSHRFSQNANSRALHSQTTPLSRANMSIFTGREHAAPPPQTFEPAFFLEHSSLLSKTHNRNSPVGRVGDRTAPFSPWREPSRPPRRVPDAKKSPKRAHATPRRR